MLRMFNAVNNQKMRTGRNFWLETKEEHEVMYTIERKLAAESKKDLFLISHAEV